MANTYKNIVITPNISSNTADPKVVYSGGNTTANTDITLYVYPDSNGSLSWEGSAGQLFSITNDLSNNIFSVNDVSGIPYLEVYANGFVSVAPFGGNVTIGNTAELILSPGTGLYANGSFGSAGQVLHSNGSAVYWAADDNSGTVTSVGTGNGLTGGAITTTGTVSVLANSGITANTTGLFVTQGTGTVVNATGVHVNATYIGTLSANNASFLGGTAAASYQLNSTLNANIASYLPTYTGVVNGSSHTVGTAFTANATVVNAVTYYVGSTLIANSTGPYGKTESNLNVNSSLYANLLLRIDDRIIIANDFPSQTLRFGFTSFNNNNTSPFADFLHMRSYADSSGGSDNLLMFNKSAIGVRVYQAAWTNLTTGNTSAYTTFKDLAFTDGTNSTGTWSINTSGAANNASFLGGTAAASYQLNSTLNANIASYLPTYTGVVNGSSHTVSTSFIANATGVYHTGTMNAASHTVGTSTIANSTGVYAGVVNATTISTGSVNVINASGLTTTANVSIGAAGDLVIAAGAGISANGGLGTAGQVLHSNGSAVYWAADDNSGGTVTSVAGGTGISGGTITTTGTLSVNASYIATITANNATFAFGLSAASTTATGSTVVTRNANGDFNGRYINASYHFSTDDVSTGTLTYLMGKFGDNYHRSATAAKVATFISGQTMNIAGNATTATGAQGSSFATATTASEGQLLANFTGQSAAYLFNNGTAWGLYSASGGGIISYSRTNARCDLSAAYTQAAGSMRAPYFYDSDNTAYYCDPAGATGLNTLGNIQFNNGRKGLIGVYDPAQTQAIFAMGSSYILTNGGSSNTYGAFYGIGWSYNPDHGAAGNNPQSKAGLNHQALFMINGVTQSAVGTGIWTLGIGTSTNSWRAPIFYDHNDTNYYVDPNAATSAVLAGVVRQVSYPFLEMTKTIAANYTITTNYNAVTVGPVTINTGVSVTIPTGSNWVVL
jgi:hypothetical protein